MLVHPIGDPDLGWHIAAGRWTLHHGQVPTVDVWNTFSSGKPWVAYSWSNELMFAGVEQHFGWPGLFVLSFGFALFISFSFYYVFAGLSGSSAFGALVSALALACCQDHFDLRPQSLTWAYFALAIYCGYQVRTGHRRKPFLFFAIVCCLWANTQITTIFGIVAAAVWASTASSRKRVLPFAAIGLLGSLLTPYLGVEWLVTLKKADHPFLYSIISEFQPASIWHPSAAVVLLSLVVLSTLYAELNQPRYLPLFMFSALFVIAGFAVQKFVPYAAVAVCATLCVLYREQSSTFINAKGLSHAVYRTHRAADTFLSRGGLIISLVALSLAGLQLFKSGRNPIDRSSLPVAAVNFIRQNRLPAPLLNDFGDGGYVMYRFLKPDGTPEQTVPIDGRTNVNDPKVMAQYVNAVFGNSQWFQYFETVKPNTVLWRNRYALPAILTATGEWCRKYSDSTDAAPMKGWSVFLRRGSHELCESRAEVKR